jgi:sulfur carrier protein
MDGSMMVVQVNGRDRELPEGSTVTALLESLDLNPALVVVELNREILERSTYPDTRIHGGDQVELVHFVGGG